MILKWYQYVDKCHVYVETLDPPSFWIIPYTTPLISKWWINSHFSERRGAYSLGGLVWLTLLHHITTKINKMGKNNKSTRYIKESIRRMCLQRFIMCTCGHFYSSQRYVHHNHLCIKLENSLLQMNIDLNIRWKSESALTFSRFYFLLDVWYKSNSVAPFKIATAS
jgi:hypothetical protein